MILWYPGVIDKFIDGKCMFVSCYSVLELKVWWLFNEQRIHNLSTIVHAIMAVTHPHSDYPCNGLAVNLF